MKKLSDDRLEHFNVDNVEKYVGWDTIKMMIDNRFQDNVFTFLDVGGGNGSFADRILDMFPKARGTVIDNAQYQLDLNVPNERKTVIVCSVDNMLNVLNGEQYDLIFYHWVLHHFVEDTYQGSLNAISNTLKSGKYLLSEGGLISILENCYRPYGNEALPSKIIFHTVSSKALAAAMSIFRVNSAGIGVCYLSVNLWQSMLENVGLTIEKCESTRPLKTSRLKSLLVLSKGIDIVHMIAKK